MEYVTPYAIRSEVYFDNDNRLTGTAAKVVVFCIVITNNLYRVTGIPLSVSDSSNLPLNGLLMISVNLPKVLYHHYTRMKQEKLSMFSQLEEKRRTFGLLSLLVPI